MIQRNIQKSILQTLAWFECVKRPLKVKELFHNLWKQDPTFEQFESTLFELIDRGDLKLYKRYVVRKKGQVDKYLESELVRREFHAKDRQVTSWLRHIPFIVGVYVVNSSAFDGQNRKSDLDLLVVCKNNFMWLGRFLVTFVIHLFGVRRYKHKVAGRVCLSFFLTDEALDLEKLKKRTHEDIYLIYWLIWARPLLHSKNIRNLLSYNHWVKDYVPHAMEQSFKKSQQFSLFANILEYIMHYTGIAFLCNALLRSYLKPRAERKHKKSTERASIIISDTILKFHEDDRRDEYFDKWRMKYELGL